MGRNLLVEMFHRGGTENDEEADPERGSLEGNCLIRTLHHLPLPHLT